MHHGCRPIRRTRRSTRTLCSGGLFFSVLFALAVGYLCLKIGQTVDAFAPVSVLAMGMAVLFHRRNAFPETVHI